MAQSKNPQLTALNEVGQSVWYDNLSKDVLKSGELAGLIGAGVSGLTSNPTIFKNAIADTSNYDDDIRSLVKQNLNTEEICEELMIKDVGAAADLLRPIYDASRGADGCASIEVSPYLARDTAGTIAAARRLWQRLNRPNVMIKIPATDEGLPAIRTALEEGLNVNITLIFSVAYHEKVMEAYLSALEARVAKQLPIDRIASVASFFVSRVDAICEKRFDELLKSGKVKEENRAEFLAKVGIANSRLAYARFKEIFGHERFRKLQAKNARVQRPLWASTGTKNPAFSPVLYVEELAGPDTVNTMPPATLKALMQKATIENRLERGVEAARQLCSRVKAMGIDLEQCLMELQSQGVKSFSDSYRELLESIEKKKTALA